ncbi:MAG: AMP-binding protein [Myxococcota bacterium]
MSPRFESRQDAAAVGMSLAWTAAHAPDRPAVLSPHGTRSFGELNRRANQLARALRREGIRRGDAIALLCANRPEFAEVWGAAQRSGLRLTCINFHLQSDEVAYIVDNCEARVLVAEPRFAEGAARAAEQSPKLAVRLAIGGPIAGFRDYDAELAAQKPGDLADPALGATMLYTSGTTGRPKGVYRRRPPEATRGLGPEVVRTAAFRPGEDLCLCTGPLYHAAPLAFNLALPLNQGIGTVLMDGWDALETLRLIESHRCTHTHMVATMFHRLIALPPQIRERFDLESMRFILHGAAPTPVEVKRRLIEWLGPIVYEYYAATEGGGTYIDSHEWLRKPGSVGRPSPGVELEVRAEDGRRLGPDEVGSVYFRAPEVGRFEYFKDDEKTASAYSGDWFTLRDMGYLDREGYLFLTGRTAELIISGGVNIYPAEVDAVLLGHPAVRDVATIGVPSEEWGEEVKAVVQPEAGFEAGEGLADTLIQHCREQLAHYKCPRTIDFASELPRADTGKIYRRRVRDRYWEGRAKSI